MMRIKEAIIAIIMVILEMVGIKMEVIQAVEVAGGNPKNKNVQRLTITWRTPLIKRFTGKAGAMKM